MRRPRNPDPATPTPHVGPFTRAIGQPRWTTSLLQLFISPKRRAYIFIVFLCTKIRDDNFRLQKNDEYCLIRIAMSAAAVTVRIA
jgi:hypothetical protein